MYATLLLMSSTLGGDVTPTPGIVLAGHSSGCTGNAAPPCCGSGSGRASMMDKVKARHALRGSSKDCCAPAPSCCAPAPSPAPCCDPCAKKERVGLLDKIKARHSKNSCCCADPCANPCGAAPATTGTTTPPKEMPKPKDKGMIDESSSAPAFPIPVPLPVTGTSGTSPSGTPY